MRKSNEVQTNDRETVCIRCEKPFRPGEEAEWSDEDGWWAHPECPDEGR